MNKAQTMAALREHFTSVGVPDTNDSDDSPGRVEAGSEKLVHKNNDGDRL